jgi:hypothetical protein
MMTDTTNNKTTEDMLSWVGGMAYVMRWLKENPDKNMTYGEMATMIGIREPGQPWQPLMRRRVTQVLNSCSAIDGYVNQSRNKTLWARFVRASDGQAGPGLADGSELVITKAANRAA